MISSTCATIIIISFFIIAGVILPILDKTKLFGAFVSLRWICCVVIMTLLIGSIIDFSMLSDEARNAMIIGGLVITALFIIIRSLEKFAAKGWNLKHDITFKKGDFSASIEAPQDEDEKNI